LTKGLDPLSFHQDLLPQTHQNSAVAVELGIVVGVEIVAVIVTVAVGAETAVVVGTVVVGAGIVVVVSLLVGHFLHLFCFLFDQRD